MPILQFLNTILQEFPLALGRQRLRGNGFIILIVEELAVALRGNCWQEPGANYTIQRYQG
jgi:hypothetical protein